MGTTLTNGIYLPNEGEKNCYAGLKTNWETLDQKIADIAALQQAVAGALHREIVESLPTTDIDPNTIYMILSGTSATENVYNEFMYVNNAWELIGTSATDLTNYYTKGDVDGLLLLKANASDLTSHTGDTTIHVTASDKSKWDTVALIKQLRLVNTQVGSSTTIAFANIDDTNGIKVGDKCMDLDAKMFEITAVDTTNQTVTVGSALIDLALDGNVVHTSGNETISGEKTFDAGQINVKSTIQEMGVIPQTSTLQYMPFMDKNNVIHGLVGLWDYDNGASEIQLNISDIYKNGVKDKTGTLDTSFFSFGFLSTGVKFTTFGGQLNNSLIPLVNSTYDVGSSAYKWKSVYAMNYYYGSNNVEFSTKFVTTDTNQTIGGAKTFSEDVVIANSDSSQTTKRLILKSSRVNLGDNNSDSWGISFNAGTSYSALINSKKSTSSTQDLQFTVRTKDTNNDLITAEYRLRVLTDGTATIEPTVTDYISLGSSANRWKDVQTNKVNGLTPSSLSLPATTGTVDISGYVTDLTGNTVNTYSPVVNGYIVITCNSTDVDYIKISNNLDFVSVVDNTNNQFTSGLLGVWQPCVAGIGVQIRIKASALNSARFIPCQGNI